MSEKTTTIGVVKRYHEKYLEYETAFNKDPYHENNVHDKLKELVDSGVEFESEEFENMVVDLMVEKPTRAVDVNNAALRFYLYTEFYMMTEKEELPDNIKEDFKKLNFSENLKAKYSVENGVFVRNEDVPIKIEREKLKNLYTSLKNHNA